MTLWLRSRGVATVVLGCVATMALLALPLSSLKAQPSPVGAMVAVAIAVALVVPTLVGWGCSRSDVAAELVTTRPVRELDLALAVVAIGAVSTVAGLLGASGVSPIGLVAARAGLTYLGILLVVRSVADWRLAAIGPTTYFLAVAVMGRGEDVAHPATWAFIAAAVSSTESWVLTLVVLAIGLFLIPVQPRRTIQPRDN